MKRVTVAVAGAAVALAALPMLAPWLGVGWLARGTTCLAMDDGEHGHAHGGGSTKGTTGETVVCALDGMKMQRSAETPSAEYKGKTYYFCSGKEKDTFLQNPERYVDR